MKSRMNALQFPQGKLCQVKLERTVEAFVFPRPEQSGGLSVASQDPDVVAILADVGLAHLVDKFADEDIDLGVLTTLEDGDLRELGLTLGQRRKLLERLRPQQREAALPEPATMMAPEPALRRVSVLFSDLVGFTELLGRIDPDEMRDILQQYYDAAQRAAQRYGGYVAALQGDGVIILFGFPVTRGVDADRAIGAALALNAALAEMPQRTIGGARVDVVARIGIASGKAIVGYPDRDLNRGLQLIGAPVNRASRLQTFARPGTILVDGATQGLATQTFGFRALPPAALKGFADKTEIFEVTAASPALAKSQPASGPRVPGAHREAEERLLALWQQAREGRPVFALVSGEAGIGKSNLLDHLLSGLEDGQARILRIHCDPLAERVPLHPVVQLLEGMLGGTLESEPSVRREILHRLFAEATPAQVDAVAEFLGLAGRAPSDLAPARLRSLFLETVAQFLVGPGPEPCLIAIEDIHWSDPTTRDLLEACARKAEGSAVMILATSRHGDDSIWTEDVDRTHVALAGLDKSTARAIMDQHLGARTLPGQVAGTILKRSNGNPLMLETLARSARGWSDAMLDQHTQIPASIYESIASRLDGLRRGDRVAAAMAVFNEPTDTTTLAGVLGVRPDDLDAPIAEMIEAGILRAAGGTHDDRLTLRHSLFQEVCYERLVKSDREALHRAVFAALKGAALQSNTDRSGKLAWHAFQGGQHEEAAPLSFAAGEAALKRSALIEANHHLDRALASLDHLGPSPEHDALRLKVLFAKSSVSRARFGIASDAVGALVGQQLDLARSLGDSRSELIALFALFAHALVGANYDAARVWAAQLCDAAEAAEDETYLMIGRRCAGSVALHTGAFDECIASMRAALAQYDEHRHGALAHLLGYDHAEISAVFLSFAQWLRGDPVGADQTSSFSVSHSRRIEHVHSLAQALLFRAMLMGLAQNGPEAMACAVEAGDLGRMHDLSVMRGTSGFMYEAADLICRDLPPTAGELASLRDGHELFRQVNPYNYQPITGALLAQAHLAGNDLDAVEAALDHAEHVQESTGETMVRPELMRLRAQVLAARGDVDAAQAGREAALDVAEEMRADMLALRILCDMVEAMPSQQAQARLQAVLDRMISHDEGRDVTRALSLLEDHAARAQAR